MNPTFPIHDIAHRQQYRPQVATGLTAIGLLCLALITPPALAMTAVDDPGAPPPAPPSTPVIPARPAAHPTAPLRDTIEGILDKTRAPVQDRQPQRQPQRDAHPHAPSADEPADAPN